MRSAVNRHTGYTPSELMLGPEVNNPATLRFKTPPGEGLQNKEGRQRCVRGWAQKTLQKAHEEDQEKLRAAQ